MSGIHTVAKSAAVQWQNKEVVSTQRFNVVDALKTIPGI